MERHFQEKTPFETHSRNNFPLVAILKVFKIFFGKKTYLFSKKSKFWTFWEFFYSSRILRQIFYNLVKKKQFHVQTWKELPMFAWTQWANITLAHLRGRFCFHIFNMAKNKNSHFFSCLTEEHLNVKLRNHSLANGWPNIKETNTVAIKLLHAWWNWKVSD